MDLFQIFLWTITGIALIGTYLNVRQMRIGFAFWMVSNMGMAFVNAMQGLLPLAFLFFVYFVLAVAGWFSWKKKPEDELARAAAVIEVAD